MCDGKKMREYNDFIYSIGPIKMFRLNYGLVLLVIFTQIDMNIF